MPNKLKGDPLILPGIVSYEEKRKIFSFCSLGQMVRIDTINFLRTFDELFWLVHVD